MASVKDMVKQQNGATPLEEKGEKKNNARRGSGTTASQETPNQENAAYNPSFSFGGGSVRDSEWFLNRDGELAVVNGESSNPALGIISISAFGASAGQRVHGTIANVTVETVLGKLTGLQVRENPDQRGFLMVGSNSRKVEKDGKANYYRDYEPNNAMKAQILSWIYPQLKKTV